MSIPKRKSTRVNDPQLEVPVVMAVVGEEPVGPGDIRLTVLIASVNGREKRPSDALFSGPSLRVLTIPVVCRL